MESKGFRLLTDPWLIDGAFEGSWCHCPPLKTQPEQLADVDALYISHLHPDHFDVRALRAFPRSIPVVCLERPPNYLSKVLRKEGFKNLIPISNGKTESVGPFEITMYEPFANHVFHESEIGNLIDSAIHVDDGEHTVLNANDNQLSVEAAKALRERHGSPTVAQLNYNAAGPYPSCFHNLSQDEKRQAHRDVLKRNMGHLAKLAEELDAEYIMPFAGAFVIGGSQWDKNEVLGTTTVDEPAEMLAECRPSQKVIRLNEGLTFDLALNRIINGEYRPVDLEFQKRYIRETLAVKPYPHERDDMPSDLGVLRRLVSAARAVMWRKQQQFGYSEDLNVYLTIGNEYFYFNPARATGELIPRSSRLVEPYITASMDERLLLRILKGDVHWNNADGGMHIDFCRVPNRYSRDFHTMMSFFHGPPQVRPSEVAHEVVRI